MFRQRLRVSVFLAARFQQGSSRTPFNDLCLRAGADFFRLFRSAPKKWVVGVSIEREQLEAIRTVQLGADQVRTRWIDSSQS